MAIALLGIARLGWLAYTGKFHQNVGMRSPGLDMVKFRRSSPRATDDEGGPITVCAYRHLLLGQIVMRYVHE